jgi:hypothetical protein
MCESENSVNQCTYNYKFQKFRSEKNTCQFNNYKINVKVSIYIIKKLFYEAAPLAAKTETTLT